MIFSIFLLIKLFCLQLNAIIASDYYTLYKRKKMVEKIEMQFFVSKIMCRVWNQLLTHSLTPYT